jgi:glutaredoxin
MKSNVRVFGIEGCSYCEEIKTKLNEGNIEIKVSLNEDTFLDLIKNLNNKTNFRFGV